MKTLVIIPTFNAQNYILETITDIKSKTNDLDILVIDHGSTDRTKYLLINNEIKHLRMPLESSYYSALSLGMKFAKDNNYDLAIEWDDKGRFNANTIKILQTIMRRKKVDFIFGSRYTNSGHKPKKWTQGTRSLRRLFRLYAKVNVTDPTMRLRGYGKKAIIEFAKDNEVEPSPNYIAELLRKGCTYVETNVKLNKKYKRQILGTRRFARKEITYWSAWIIFVLPFRKRKEVK